jgi:hypothetical protein
MFENTGATIPMVPLNTKIAVKENVHLVRPKEEKVEHGDKGKGKSRVECQPREENAFNSSGVLLGHLVVNTTLLDNRFFVAK